MVIVIIASLAALALTVGPKMRKRADAAKSVENMRQIGALLGTYAADNSFKLPPARADVPDGNGSYTQLHWFEAMMYTLYPDLKEEQLHDDKWWESSKPLLRNPLCNAKTKPWAWTWWNPGYAINRQIVDNLGLSSGDWSPGRNGPQSISIPLSMIPEPARTPIVAPRGDWHFTYSSSEIKEAGLKGFLVDGKVPILFVDGHVETMPLNEYTRRKLTNVPAKKSL